MPRKPPVFVPPLVALGRERRALEIKPPKNHGDDNRPHSRARGYDRTWEKLRAMHLAEEPYCRRCGERGIVTPADMVDHVVTIDEDPTRRLDPANLQSLCDPCHSGPKQRADKRRAKARRRTDEDSSGGVT